MQQFISFKPLPSVDFHEELPFVLNLSLHIFEVMYEIVYLSN